MSLYGLVSFNYNSSPVLIQPSNNILRHQFSQMRKAPAIAGANRRRYSAISTVMSLGNRPTDPLASWLISKSFADFAYCASSVEKAYETAVKLAMESSKAYEVAEFIAFKNDLYEATDLHAILSKQSNESKEKLRVSFLKYDDMATERTLNIKPGKTGAIFVDPLQAGQGVGCASAKNFLQSLRDTCDKAKALLVFDEVKCDIGRTGYLLAHEAYGVFPDMMIAAVPPLAEGKLQMGGAILMRKRVFEVIDCVKDMHNYNVDANYCKKVVEEISKPEFLKTVAENGRYSKDLLLQRKLERNNNSHMKVINGLGLIIDIELDVADAKPVLEACQELGVHLLDAPAPKRNIVRLGPSLKSSKEELEHEAELFCQALAVLDEA